MKKYYQVTLWIISILSLTLFLVYRHEYNRLHYILEVFNFFGQPCNFSGLEQSEKILAPYDWGPIPLWQENEEKDYIFSAFLVSDNKVKAVAIESGQKKTRNCYLWFENQQKPKVGTFKISQIANDKNTNLNAAYYLCSFKKKDSLPPYAVSFTYATRSFQSMKKIIINPQINKTSNFSNRINATLCILPSYFDKKLFLEFLSYHKLIGIDNYVFYNFDIPYHINKLILNLSNKLQLHTTYLPWNFPKNDKILRNALVESDCMLRVSARSKHFMILDIREYIVPLFEYSFNSMIASTPLSGNRITLPVKYFCIDKIKEKGSLDPIVVQNVNVLKMDNNYPVQYIYRNISMSNLTYVDEIGQGSIHKYIECDNHEQKTDVDKSILRYSTDLIRSTLVQLLRHEKV